MLQVLYHLPYVNIPIYGYGFMLFCAYMCCTWLAARLALRDGVPKEPIQDLTVWLFVFGIAGARITYIVQYFDQFATFWQFFAVWDGGLVFYGSIFGAAVGYALAYRFQLKKFGISHWKMADVVAPCLALGLCLGRVGCLLNGCCYGNVACASCPAIQFPMASEPRKEMVRRGHQTPAGFLTFPDSTTVAAVEPMSPLAEELKPGDTISQVQGVAAPTYAELAAALGPLWPRGERSLDLEVKGTDGAVRNIGPLTPLTIGLHPTQIYESISMALLLFYLMSYYPYKTHDGSLMVLFMFVYGIHRFLNEMLRTDNEPFAFGLTFSQNISIGVIIAATIMAVAIWRREPAIPAEAPLSSDPFNPIAAADRSATTMHS